jgi:hypothetical protein
MTTRVRYLEGLRGIAALQVVLLHFVTAFAPNAAEHAPAPLPVLFDGHTAVYVFFLISGAVLTPSFARRSLAQSGCQAPSPPGNSGRRRDLRADSAWTAGSMSARCPTLKSRHGSANATRRGGRIKWKFTTPKAREELGRAYPDTAKES